MYMKYTNILKNDQPTADVKPLCLQMLNHIWSVFLIHHLPQHLLTHFKELQDTTVVCLCILCNWFKNLFCIFYVPSLYIVDLIL